MAEMLLAFENIRAGYDEMTNLPKVLPLYERAEKPTEEFGPPAGPKG